MTTKSFLFGAAASALLGFWAYTGLENENLHLQEELRKREVEQTTTEMQTAEFLRLISEMEKENITHYNEIVGTTKKYASLVINEAKTGKYRQVREMVGMYKKLDNHSNRIESNNKQLYDVIRQYIETKQRTTEF